ncbi:hypothetical protein [Marinicellulosiphila megalodicopiae]|uniref:hypothetical protein n=1 Tax=Marinicellulosiphila megalodicopiae TaxID=2724896 RepID=UPI003BAE3E32
MVNHADFSRTYFAKWNDDEFLKNDKIEVQLENDLFNLNPELNDEKLNYNVVVTLDESVTFDNYIRHSFSGFSELVWSLCFDKVNDLFLGRAPSEYSGLSIIRLKRNIYNPLQIKRINDIAHEINRRMMLQKIKGTDITPHLEIELI